MQYIPQPDQCVCQYSQNIYHLSYHFLWHPDSLRFIDRCDVAHSPGDGALQCCILDNILIMADVSGSECSTFAFKMSLSTRHLLSWNSLASGSRKLFLFFFELGSSRRVTWRDHTYPDRSREVCVAWALFQIERRWKKHVWVVVFFLLFFLPSAAREKRQGIKERVSTLCLNQLRRRALWIGPHPSPHLSCLPKTIIHFCPLNISQRGGSPSEPSC